MQRNTDATKQQEELLKQSVRVDVIGKLADSCAHQLNNVLATIVGLASVIEAEVEADSPIHRDVQGIIAASKKGLEMTRSLLGFSLKRSLYMSRISPNNLMGKLRGLLQPTFPHTITVATQLGKDAAEFEGDVGLIRHAIIQLATNAADAIRGKGTVTLATCNEVVKASDLPSIPGIKPGKYVCFKVSDNGRGMDTKTAQQAFDPFFSTKLSETAAGLGLPMVQSIVQRHGGYVSLYTKQGLGTTVTIYLPAAEAAPAEDEVPAERPRTLRARSETILVVDDEQLFRKMAKRVLEKLGFTVLLAAGGKEALELYDMKKEEVSLVFLDIIMPEMDGPEVFKRLQEINPQLKVLISSGFGHEGVVEKLLDMGAVGFIQKPCSLDELAEELNRILGQP